MSMNRRGFFGRIGAALAGCVLANTPLAGKLWEPEASLVPEGVTSWMTNPGMIFSRSYTCVPSTLVGIQLKGISEILPPEPGG